MTSTATPQNSTQATNTAAHSYASAASASKKPANPNTVVASGSTPAPVVVGSSAKSASPANGRPAIPPAVPVVHGSVNGGTADHARKPSVTISANASAASTTILSVTCDRRLSPNNPALHNQPLHTRQGSNISMASTGDMGNQGMPGPNRGGYHHGGRGRGYNNAPYNSHPQTGYPPQGSFRNGHGQGRNSMAPAFQPQPPPRYANSPQPTRGSPAMMPSNPNTPNMAPAMPVQTPPQFYAPPMGAQPNMPPYGYPTPGAVNQYPGPMQHMGPTAMSRTPSTSEKPNLGAGPGGQPVVVSTPQMSQAQGKPPVVSGSGNSLARPKKSAAIVIKRPDGEIVDVANIKSSSPAPTSRTPPVVSSTATPPTKPSTPSHTRTESAAPLKTKEEIQAELRNKIARATAQTSSDADSKAEEAAKAEAEEKAKVEAEAKAKKEAEEKAKAEAEQKAKEEAEKKAKEEAAAKAKKEAEDKAKAEAEAEAKKKEAAAAQESEEEEMERIIREMEEADRLREAEEEKRRIKSEAAKAEAKKKADADRATVAAENDRKLREAEREMERLEEEKERRAQANADSGKSFTELLAQARSGKVEESAESPKVDSVTDKLATMSIGGDSKPSTPTSATGKGPDKQQRKPAALNLSITTKPVEAPQPSAALQSLKTSRFLTIKEASNPGIYAGSSLASPNPAVNAAVGKRGQAFKYDAAFLLQFQNVFTEQPSLEFHARPNAREAPVPTASSMGSFGRTLPPGTTSEQRIAMSSGAAPRPTMPGMGGFRGPSGQFAGSLLSNSGRSPSNSGMGPNSPRQPSGRGHRAGGSQRPGYNSQKDAQAAKTMPLTQGMDLKPITVSAGGWKPTSIGRKTAESASDHLEPELVQRKVKAALNKMTPENFDRISDQILTIANQSKNENDGRTLRQVIQLTFEKATDEPHFSSTYAKFCKRMLDQMSPDIKDDTIKDKHGNVVNGGNLFRKYLLNRCQEEYERGWSVPDAPEGEEKKVHGAELLSDEYYLAAAAKRRGLGLVRFIGELFKLGMLTERIIHGCVHGLVDFKEEPKEAEIESLSFLLRTVGAQLDASEKGKPMMDAYFKRIQNMIDLPELENRLKFMLMDVRDLRQEGWKSVEANKGPKTLDEVRAEAEQVAAAKAAEAARSQRGGGGLRPQMGRGDARSMSSGYGQTTNTVGMDDLKRLKSNSRLPSAGITLGPHSMLASRSNSGRRPGGPGALGRSGDNSGMSSRTGTLPRGSRPTLLVSSRRWTRKTLCLLPRLRRPRVVQGCP
ncbi:unnamed protein product [Parascedosporium putredinis]|uniref:MIF4G domain-containing protein n=1 Tax=Parascedosporium putredinis TaxID=1442378 RepID=A0A9P1GW83_9PEZI|nr:unnamed protein product [Parascedosporium putredinis]CAI7989274.1 unnamed protein product [Parascedosporium putredinis]